MTRKQYEIHGPMYHTISQVLQVCSLQTAVTPELRVKVVELSSGGGTLLVGQEEMMPGLPQMT
jgi:hypothetical protein